MKILKFYAALIVGILVVITPNASQALLRGSGGYGANSCGISTNNWCIQANGWTKVTPVPVAGGRSCTAGTALTTESCAATADNSTAASFNATLTSTSLAINSGTPPAIGQTVVVGTTAIARVASGTGPFTVTLIGTPGNQTADMTSSPGNDATCTLNSLSGQTSETLDTYVPSKPCYTAITARGLFRDGSPDWMLLKGGQSWVGGPSTDGAFTKSGTSKAAPGYISSYGGGYAQLTRIAPTQNYSFRTQSTSGKYLIVQSFEHYDPLSDPASPLFRGIALTGDTGPANCGYAADINGTITNNGAVNTLTVNSTASGAVAALQYIEATTGITAGRTISGAGPTFTVSGTLISVGPEQIKTYRPTLCNTTPAIASWVASECPTYTCFIIGTGVTNKLTSAPYTANSLTLNGADFPYTQTGVKFQIMSANHQMSMDLSGVTNFMLVEDNHFIRSNISTTQNSSISTCIDLYVRRNTGVYGWVPGTGTNQGSSAQSRGCPSNLYEENVWNYGGFDPSQWLGGYSTQTHCIYDHDPSTPFDLKNNIVANCSATGAQDRDAGIAYNNLWIDSPTALYAVASSGNLNASYNVVDGGAEFNLGERVASSNLTSGTTINFQGIQTYVTNIDGGAYLINLDNPGSVVGTINTAGVTAYDTVTLTGTGAGIFAGIRLDGVKIGDRLRMVRAQGKAYDIQLGSQYLLTGGAATVGGFAAYAPNSTVSISAGGAAAVVTEANAQFARPNDEMFSFTGTTPPTGLSLGSNTGGCTGTVNTNPFTSVQTCEYYSVNSTGTTYNLAATLGGSPIVATGSTVTNVGRTGSRVFQFAATYPTIDAWSGLPAWISVGDQVSTLFTSSFTGAMTKVQAISPDRKTVTTSDPSVASFQAQNVSAFMFGGVGNPNVASIKFTNNVAVRGINHAAVVNITALTVEGLTWGVTGNGYFHNWNVNPAFNYVDNNTGSGNTNAAAYTASNTVTATLSDYDLTKYYDASVAAYDASLVNNTFTASIASGIMTVTSGAGPNVGDTVFDATGANGVMQYTEVASNPTAGSFVLTKSQIVTSRLMKSGSQNHFINQALANRKKTTYDLRYTASPANNWVRSKIKCGDPVEFPGSPACPQQP